MKSEIIMMMNISRQQLAQQRKWFGDSAARHLYRSMYPTLQGTTLLNVPTPASFSFIFGVLKQTIQFLQLINVKKCPSSIRRRDSNPDP